MKAILAINNLGFIGIDDKLLWHNTDDLIHFKSLTEGNTLLVGYRTAQSLPPLKNRVLITDNREGFNFEPEWCIGGKKTYEKYAPYFTELHISHINNNLIGNVVMPDFTKLNPNCKIFNYYY